MSKQNIESSDINPISSLFPENGKILLTGGGKQFVERIGIEAIRNVVQSVLLGENLRSQTEPLSRRRIAQVSGAVLAMLTQGYLSISDFQNKISEFAVQQLRTAKKNDNSSVWPAQWVIGLTGKSVQNVLRSDPAAFTEYIREFEMAVKDAATHCHEQYGKYTVTLGYIQNEQGKKVELDWEGITRLTTMIGAQTLTIRGSDKSMYGKLFEKLVLGSVLSILGFKRVDRRNNQLTENVFWLSDSSANRESDATVLITAGKVARFDIGFIGPGNPEISKDKLSRFDAELVHNSGRSNSTTFIVVDRLPQTSKTVAAAKKIGAEIIQMSMQYWPRELSIKIGNRFPNFKHKLQTMPDEQIAAYIHEQLSNMPIQDFLSNVTLNELDQE